MALARTAGSRKQPITLLMESGSDGKSNRKTKRRAKRINRLFDDIKTGAIIQVERKITKVAIHHSSSIRI
jgi:hypothetical protein